MYTVFFEIDIHVSPEVELLCQEYVYCVLNFKRDGQVFSKLHILIYILNYTMFKLSQSTFYHSERETFRKLS